VTTEFDDPLDSRAARPRAPGGSLGARLRAAREARRLSRPQLAIVLGGNRVSASTIAKLEQGELDWVRRYDEEGVLTERHRALLAALAAVVRTSLGELLEDASSLPAPEPSLEVGVPRPPDSAVPSGGRARRRPPVTRVPLRRAPRRLILPPRPVAVGMGVTLVGAAILLTTLDLRGQPAARGGPVAVATRPQPAPALRVPEPSGTPRRAAPALAGEPTPGAPPPPQVPVPAAPPPRGATRLVLTAARPGGPAALTTPQVVDFGVQRVGTTQARTVTLTNTGTAVLHVEVLTLVQGVDADVADHGCDLAALAPGQRCSFTVTFHPGQPETENAAVYVTDDAVGGSQRIPVVGRAV
jgi:transcriptional regulator with XRE-family HTH domain